MNKNSPDQPIVPESAPESATEAATDSATESANVVAADAADTHTETHTETPELAATTPPDSSAPKETADPAVVAQAELPGERLAAKRRAMRWSIDEVSGRLKLAPRQIEAVEANDFAALPGMATARGFIRSYAKLLELEPEPLLKLIASEPNPAFEPMVVRRPLPSAGFSGRRYAASSGGHRNAARNMAGLAVLVLILLVVIAFAANRMGWLALPFSLGPITANMASASVAEAPAGQVTPEVTSAEADTSAASIDQANMLVINVRQGSWVEINTQTGNKLFAREMQAGTSERFEIREPVVLVVGNASGVDANFRGQALNLLAVAPQNVAKLSLK